MTISEERLRQAMVDHGVSETRADEIITELRTPPETTETAAPSAAGTRQRLLVVSDPQGRCRHLELTGWVIKVDDNFAIGDLPSRLLAAGVDHNLAARNRNSMVNTIGDILDGVSSRVLRERGIYRQHREPVFVTFVGRTAIASQVVAEPSNPVNTAPAPTNPYPGGIPIIALAHWPDAPVVVGPEDEEVPAEAPTEVPTVFEDDDSLTA